MDQRDHIARMAGRTFSVPTNDTGGDPTTVYIIAAGIALAGLLLIIFVG